MFHFFVSGTRLVFSTGTSESGNIESLGALHVSLLLEILGLLCAKSILLRSGTLDS